MSEREQATVVGEQTIILAESKKKLTCWRAKADQAIERLERVQAALHTESDTLYADLDDLPTRAELEEIFGGIRRERNIVIRTSAKLREIAPDLPLSDPD